MAQGIRFVCRGCKRDIEAWDDGNPYYLDEDGKKRYAYHPQHDLLERCIGNDTPHLCLACAHQFMVDSRAPIAACPECGASEIVNTLKLTDKACPYCKTGEFAVDPGWSAIS